MMHNNGSPNFRVSRARMHTVGGCGDWEDFVAEDADGAVLEDMDMFACCPTPAFAFAFCQF